MTGFHSTEELRVLLDLAEWGSKFPSSPFENHFGTAKITVTFPETNMRVLLMEDGLEVHDIPSKESK